MSWLSLLTLCASLFAAPLLMGAPAAIDTSALATSENDPSSLIEGKVSAITGDLYLFQEDLVIQGYEPIPICRSYISHGRKPLWTFLPHLIAEDTLASGYLITEPNGSKFYYHHVSDFKEGKEKYSRWEPRELGRSGYSNTSRGEISALSNVKNSYVILDGKEKSLTLHCSDGTVRSYKKIHHDKEKNHKQRYLLQSEQLSNGNRIFYTFDDRDKLRLIRTTDPSGGVTYATAEFRYLNPKDYDILNCDIIGSDGQVIRYRHSNDGYLNSMTNSSPTPDQQWKYYNLNYAAREGWKPVLSQIEQPLGRLTSFTYYDKNEETIAGIHVVMQDIRGQEYADGGADYQWDARRDRVSRIQAPVGEDARLYDTSRIIYDLKQQKTSVYDVEGCRTDYFWDEDFHLKKIERFSKEGIFHHAEQFAWGGGNLLCRSLIDQNRKVLFAQLYTYDPYGNVAIEKLYGNLSGKGAAVILDDRGLPFGFVKAAVSKIARVSTQRQGSRSGFLGHKGFELKNPKYQKVRNNPTIIQDRPYSSHALDQMQNRGLMPSVVEDAIQGGVAIPNKTASRMQFYDPINNISVITENGRVVTVMHGRSGQ